MALRTVSNAGGNWNATTTWVGGVVPLATDTVDFTATSGNLTVNVASTCIGINFTNYVNTITFTALLSINGPVNLGTGGYTQAGASGIQVGVTSTLTSGGVTWSRLWTFGGSSTTYTLAGNWTFTGTLTFSASGVMTLNSNILNTTNLSVTNNGSIQGTTNIVFNGTGTWSHTTYSNPIKNNITINTTGILTLGTNIYYDTGTLTYTAGTVITTGSTLNIAASTILDTDRGATQIDWNNITTAGTVTLTLLSNLNTTNLSISFSTLSFVLNGFVLAISNNLTLNNSSFNVPQNLQVTNLILGTGGGNIDINGLFTISVSGNLTENRSTATITSGTTSILLNGTGTWSNASTGPLRNNLTINSPSGTITIGGNVRYDTGTLTHIAGTVTTAGSTLFILGNATIAASGVTWNNVTISGSTATLTLSQDLYVTGTFQTAGSTNTINGNNVYITSTFSPATTILTTGTSHLRFTGASCTWTGGGVVRNNVTITGTVTFTANIGYNTGTFTCITGAIISAGRTLVVNGSTSFNCPSVTFNAISQQGSNGTITLLADLTTTTFTSATGAGGTILAGAFTLYTSTLTATSPISGTPIILNGTGTWSGSGAVSNNLTINTAGTLTVSGTVNYNTGTLTYTAGTVTTTSSTLTVSASATLNTGTSTIEMPNGIIWNIVTIPPTTNTSIALSSNFNIINTLTLSSTNAISISFSGVGIFNPTGPLIISTGVGTNGTLTINLSNNISVTNLTITINGSNYSVIINNNTINISGDLTKSGASNILGTIRGTTAFILNGTGTWSHTSAVNIQNNLTINSPSGTITISGNVYYNTGTLTYTSGTVTTTGSTLNISASTTLNTNGITWNNVTITTGTTTLSSNLTVGGTLTLTGTMTGAFTITTVNLTTGTSSINVTSTSVTGNLTINGVTSGTSPITLNGTGAQTWSAANIAGTYLSNNLTINKSSGTLTISGFVYYTIGTMTYTAGTVTTTGSTLVLRKTVVNQGVTLNTNGINWSGLLFDHTVQGGTYTLTLMSDFTITSSITFGTSTFFTETINFTGAGFLITTSTCNMTVGVLGGGGSFVVLNLTSDLIINNLTVNAGGGIGADGKLTLNNNNISISGNLSFVQNSPGTNIGCFINGTGSLTMVGTGTWSSTYQPIQISGSWFNTINVNLTFNTSGTITISGNIGFGGNNTIPASITYVSGTINAVSSTIWIAKEGSGSTSAIFNTSTILWGNIYFPRGSSSNDVLTLLSDLNVSGIFYFFTPASSASTGFILNGSYNINIGSLNQSASVGIGGTATFVFNKTGSWTHSTAVSISNNVIINTAGTITISGNVYYNTRTLTYINGKVITKNSTLNLTAASTLINCHKINFDNVVITSGVNITMNEFFSGSPGFKTTISPSSTTNYTIAFQDAFEKFAKFVKVTRATVSRPGQLTVITDKGNRLNNVGIKFAPNQITNGLPKNSPSTNNINPNGLSPTYLVTDPTLS